MRTLKKRGYTRNSAAILCIATSMLCASAAQLLFRYAMQRDPLATGVVPEWDRYLEMAGTGVPLILLLGLFLYGVSMLVWIFALTRFDVSLAYPVLSLSYIVVYFAATCLPYFDEAATPERLFGVVLISAGVAMLVTDARPVPD